MVEKRGEQQIDKARVSARFRASAASYDSCAIAQQYVYEALGGRLRGLGLQSFGRVLEVGCGTGGFSRYIDERWQVEHWTLNDLHPAIQEAGRFAPRKAKVSYLIGDAEQIDLGRGYDLIVSASALQWFHDPRAFLKGLSERLRPEGVLLLSTFGVSNLYEFKALTSRGLSYAERGELETWLAESFGEYSVEEELYPLEFTSPREVLLHLKHTGVTGTADGGGFWTPSKLRSFVQDYQERYSTPSGGVHLTYHPIYILARKD